MAVSDTARAVKLWQAALRKIEELPAAASTAESPQQDAAPLAPTAAAADDSLPTVKEFLELPRLHSAAWNRLVADLKIPLQLGQTVASTSDSLAPMATAALSAINALIHKAYSDNYLQLEAPSAISKQLGLQLKQSGFLAALPKLLAAAATALADTQHNSEVLTAVPHTLDPSRSTSAQHLAAVKHVLRMREVAGQLLVAVTSPVHFWPQHWDRHAVAAPALRLCMVTMQHCSRCADLITPAASAAAVVAPTALEKLTAEAYLAVQAVFTAWDPERLTDDDTDIGALEGPDAMRAACAAMIVPIICPQQFYTETKQLLTNLDARIKNPAKLRHSTPGGDSNSVETWQFACAHDSEVTEIQQQTLQALGCSSRLFMYMAGTALKPLMNANTSLGMANVYLMLAKHRVPLADLERPAEVRKLAESLQELQEGATPPGTSPLTPCAPLLWLVPALLLEWAGKQPARGPHFAYQNYMFSTLFWPAVEQVVEQFDWWAKAEHYCYNAAGGDAGRQEQQLAMLNAMRAVAMGSGWAPIVPASHLNLTPEQQHRANFDRQLYQAASEAADECRKAWAPPAVSLAQLLQQTGGAAVRMLACMQAEADAEPASSSSGSSSTHSNPVSSKPSSKPSSSSKGRSSKRSRSKYGDVAPVSSDTDATILSRALLRLSQGSVALLNLSYRVLWFFVNKARLAARRNPMVGMERYGLVPDPDRVGNDPGQLDADEQASLAALCAALQEAVPQLASLADAAMRTSAQELETEVQYTQLAIGSNFMHALQVPGVFVAAGLQPGSPALKPLASLTATLLKVVAAAQENPEEPCNVAVAALALSNTLCYTSIVLEVACSSGSSGSSNGGRGMGRNISSGGRGRGSSSGGSSGSSSYSGPDAVTAVLTGSKAVSDTGNRWSAEHLSVISNACKLASNNSSSTSGTSGSSGNGGGCGIVDAFAMVPWLVGLGRCCLGYVGAMRAVAGGGAEGAAATVGGHDLQEILANLDFMGGALQGVTAALPGWLQSRNVTAQLASAGYVNGPLPDLLLSFAKAQKNAAQAGPAVLAQLAQGLGLALSSMPFGSACNNPLCRELGQLSEQQLVMGSARKCSGCRVARYCCKACQVAHWKQHKPACKAMAAATAQANTSA